MISYREGAPRNIVPGQGISTHVDERPFGVYDLFGELPGFLVSVIRPDHRVKRDGDRAKEREPGRRIRQRTLPSHTIARGECDHDDAAECHDLRDGDEILYPASRRDADDVDRHE